MLNIYNYTDYKEYLNDFYDFNKKRNSKFSYATFAGRAEISSKGFVKLLFDGKRNISLQTLPKMIKGLHLNKTEGRYFSLLVQYQAAKKADKKAEIYQEIITFPGRMKLKPLEVKQHVIYNSTLHFPIIEMLKMKDCKRDIKSFPHWVKENIDQEADLAQINQAIKELLSVDILEIEDGYYKESKEHVSSVLPYSNPIMNRFHTDFIDLAKKYIGKKCGKKLAVATINIRSEDKDKIDHDIDTFFRDLIAKYCQHDNTEEVYNINLQFFPITKKEEE